ncbi:SusC/RagA family TonB-linked outer membrane protein [Flavobacterium muglaense]|uniref:TonB-dependent receptor n=1 Tax=Flavobacterium muglaense TaxID=2764716 RepID=A0A923SHC8_9FLAO|nr:TonB-dependent receptor [Flavobacterium muglaense]MBC5839074.1 TonB-dependent receptor [Flavobacterium muglaense]MBC5845549.1 TonB-dependent receptor [Flavobacterium muglaense]
MKLNKSLIFCFLSVLFAVYGQAQEVSIKGKVIDENGLPIPGVTILTKGSSKATASDMDGAYQIKAASNGTLVFSYIGYASVKENINGRTVINVSLHSESQSLQEVVINVGYGTQKKKNVTNAIATIKAGAFEDRPILNVAQAIQGNAAGVNVVQTSGKPGASFDVRIRGLSSINSENSPLYVVDGIQTKDISGLNTEDIVDLSILKDATATAIYGVNGSSGVVIITTKKGKSNTNDFQFSSYLGFSKAVSNVDVLNLTDYKTLVNEINPSYLTTANDVKYTGINTNWQDEILRTGIDQNYNFSYAGGTEKVKFYSALGYQVTEGIINPSKYNRFSGKINVNANLLSWLKTDVSFNIIQSDGSYISDNNSVGQGGAVMSALVTPAFLPTWGAQLNVRETNADGSYKDGYKDGQYAENPYQSGWENPVSLLSRQNKTAVNRYLSSISFDVSILPNLVWKPMVSFDFTKSDNIQFVDPFSNVYGRNGDNNPSSVKGRGSNTVDRNNNLNFENTLNYQLKFDSSDLNLLGGISMQSNKYTKEANSGTGFSVDQRSYDYSIAQNQFFENRETDVRSLSYFGRATYSLKNKYIVNAVFRQSGASQLSADNKWGFFPAVSAAWIVSNEDFLKEVSAISELKLRGGWGKTGNLSGLPAYSSFDLNYTNPLTNTTTLDQIGNPDLKWETTTDVNLGLDLGLLKNRIKFTADIYKKNTKDLLQIIYFPGFSKPYYYNAGEIENKGLELGFNTVNLTGDFKWNSNFNISFNTNKVVQLGLLKKLPFQNLTSVGESVILLTEGSSLGSFYGYKVDKVDAATGELLYKDTNEDGVITPNDRTNIGNPNPNYTFGFSNDFKYKGFSLDALITGSQGGAIFNASRMDLTLMNNYNNQSTEVLNRWTTVGQVTDVPKANEASALHVSDRFVEDGSYVRLKAVTLGYTFKLEKLKLNAVKLYVTGQNLYIITNYKGFDPEVGAFNNASGIGQGIDLGTYPQVKTFIFGLKANF